MKKYRNYTDEFKNELIAEIDSGHITVAQAARDHNISPSLIDRWRLQLHEGTMIPRKTKHEKELEKELERYKIKVAELTLANDLLKKAKNSTYVKKCNGYVATLKNSVQSERLAE